MKKYIYLFIISIGLPLLGFSQPSNYLLLDGTESVVVGNANDLNTGTLYNRTVEFWFKADDVNHTNREIIYEEGGNVRGINFWVEDGSVYLGIYNDADGTDRWYGTWFKSSISSGMWYHVAIVLRGGDNSGYPGILNENLEWYLNGAIQDVGHGGVLHDHPGDIRLSSTQVGVFPKTPVLWVNNIYEATASNQIQDKTTSHFTGAVGLFRIWNSARTEANINDNKNTLISTIGTDGLVAYLNGDKVTDTGGDSGSDGTEIPAVNPTDLTYDNKEGNDDWHDPQNWYGSNTNDRGNLPSNGDDITIKINGNGQTPPVISSGQYYFSNVTIANKNILNLLVGVYFNVTDELTNDGIIQVESSNVLNTSSLVNNHIFFILPSASLFASKSVVSNINSVISLGNNSVLQTNSFFSAPASQISMSGAVVEVLDDLTNEGIFIVDPTSRVSVISQSSIFKNLDIFKIKSDATGTGSLITNGSVTNTGTFTVERYVNYKGIGTMSSPVSGATTSVFTGKVNGDWGIEVMGHTEDTRRIVNGNSNSFYPINVASNTPLNVMEGYAFEMNSPAQTIVFNGTPNTGDQIFTLTSTQYNGSYYGWNLVGNPYPSAITWTHLTNVIDTTVIGSTMYVYNGADNDADADSWLSFNPNDPLPPNGELDHIPLGGAFFVKLRDAEPNLTITLTNDFRVHNNDNVNFGSIEEPIAKKLAKKSSDANLPDNFFQLVSKANGKIDKANYHWLEEATSDLDLQFDSHKMIAWGPDNPNVFFWAGEEMASLQQEPETETIQVGYSSYTSGEVEFSIENVTTFAEVILEDKQSTEPPVDLLKSSYVFTATGEDENRFVIYLKKNTLSEVEKNLEDTKIYASEKKIYFSFTEKISEGTVLVYDIQGRIVRNFAIANDKIFELETNLSDGVYVVKINADGNHLSKTILLQQ